jgi:hypothetical protein
MIIRLMIKGENVGLIISMLGVKTEHTLMCCKCAP